MKLQKRFVNTSIWRNVLEEKGEKYVLCSVVRRRIFIGHCNIYIINRMDHGMKIKYEQTRDITKNYLKN